MTKLTHKDINDLVMSNFEAVATAVMGITAQAHFEGMSDQMVEARSEYDLKPFVDRAYQNCYGNVDSQQVGKGPLDIAPIGGAHEYSTKGWLDQCEAKVQAASDAINDGRENLAGIDDGRTNDQVMEQLTLNQELAHGRYFVNRMFLNACLTAWGDITGKPYRYVKWVSKSGNAAQVARGSSLFAKMGLTKNEPSGEQAAESA